MTKHSQPLHSKVIDKIHENGVLNDDDSNGNENEVLNDDIIAENEDVVFTDSQKLAAQKAIRAELDIIKDISYHFQDTHAIRECLASLKQLRKNYSTKTPMCGSFFNRSTPTKQQNKWKQQMKTKVHQLPLLLRRKNKIGKRVG